MDIELHYHPGTGSGEVVLPHSKSIATRATMLMRLGGGESNAAAAAACRDSAELDRGLARALRGEGAIHITEGAAPLRFLMAAVASIEGKEVCLTAGKRLSERPHGPLLRMLRQAGAEIEEERKPDGIAFHIHGRRLRGGVIETDVEGSSQYLSAAMMAAPLWERGALFELRGCDSDGGFVSRPYAELTAAMMRQCGAEVRVMPGMVEVAPGGYSSSAAISLEPDWSAAAFIYEVALLTGRPVRLARLTPPRESLQGDSACAGLFAGIGVATRWEPDGSAVLEPDEEAIASLAAEESPLRLHLGDTPDLVPPLAIGMAAAGIRYEIRGVGNLRHKESDRLASLEEEGCKSGFRIEAGSDSLVWRGERIERGGRPMLSAHGDHRIAMALAPVAAVAGPLRISGAESVDKSFPGYWRELRQLSYL